MKMRMHKIQKIFSIFGGITAVLLPFGDVFCKCSSDNKEMLISMERATRENWLGLSFIVSLSLRERHKQDDAT